MKFRRDKQETDWQNQKKPAKELKEQTTSAQGKIQIQLFSQKRNIGRKVRLCPIRVPEEAQRSSFCFLRPVNTAWGHIEKC